MRSQNLRSARHEVIEGVVDWREAFRICLAQIIGGVTMHNRVGEVHARAAARGHADRVHPAAKEQTLGFSGFTQHEHTVGGETLGAIQ